MKQSLIFIFLLFFIVTSSAQQVKNEDLVYDENIHTVLLHRAGNQLEAPFIRLGSKDKLQLSFDDMSNETYRFKYTFIHCDRNWRPTQLEQFEYLDGYMEDDILRYEFSVNAIPGYIHYELSVPKT